MTERNEPCWCGSGKKYKKCHLSSDHQNRQQKKEPPQSTGNGFVKSAEQIEGMRKAGVFNGELMDYIRDFVKEGVSTEQINQLVHDYTLKHGHKPACLGYRGFPKSVCTSRNEVVCHGIPRSNEVLLNGDIVNIDLTTIVGGYYGDSSETFFIGEVSDKARHLVDVTAKALVLGIDAVRPGVPLMAVAEVIEPFVKSQGCSVVKQYTGHGIGLKFHEEYTVYHHIEPHTERIILTPGMTFTIEPMINLGGYEVVTDRKDKWTVRTKDGSLSAQFEHTVVVTESGVEVLTLTPLQRKEGIRLRVDGVEYR